MTISEVESTGAGPLIPILASIIWIPVGMFGLMLAPQPLLAIGNGNSWFENGLMDIGFISLPLARFATVPLTWAVWVNTRRRAGTTKWRVLASLLPLVSIVMVVMPWW